MIRLVGLSLRVPKLCGGQSCGGQRKSNKGLKKNNKACIITKSRASILDTLPNVVFNDAFDLIENPVISSAVVAGPPVECRCPIR